jgi:hypothetical protein
MSDFLYPCRAWPEGPLGFPMPDAAAKALDKLLRTLPANDAHAYRHAVVTRAPTELNPGERSDVSWISTESVDRMGEVILARGMDDSQFRLNPLVTLGHDYDLPPVGRSSWRRRVRDGAMVGIKAKTVYPTRPDAWPASEPWLPDQVFALVQAGLLRGKSIGFLPLQAHVPDDAEVQRHGWAEEVRLVVDRWLLLEYACVSLPANQHALVEAVSKGEVALAEPLRHALGLDGPPVVGFTSEAEVASAIHRRVGQLDLHRLIGQAVRDAVDRARGRI